MTAKHGWALIIGGVLVYEVLCAEGELLSEGVDKAIDKHPILTRAAVLIVAGHLANLIPQSVDPIHWVASFKH